MAGHQISYEWKPIDSGNGKTPNIRLNSTAWHYKKHIWLMCGAGSGVGKSSEVWKFSLDEREWQKVSCTGEPPSRRDGQTGTYIGSGKFIIFGGQGFPEPNSKLGKYSDSIKTKTYLKREPYNDLYQFDCDNLKWSPIYPDGLNVPMGRRGHSATFIGNEGNQHPQQVKTAREDHTEASTFTFSTFPSPRTGSPGRKPVKEKKLTPRVEEVPSNSILMFGGSGIELSKYAEQLYNEVWLFCLDTNSWTRHETRGIEPRPMFEHRALRMGDSVIVIGGIIGPPKTPTGEVTYNTDVLALNLKTSTWTAVEIYDVFANPIRFHFHGFSMVPDIGPNSSKSKIFIFGGDEVVDSKTAAKTKKLAVLPHAYPEDYTFSLDLIDGCLTPLPLKGEIPLNRYGHIGVSGAAVENGASFTTANPGKKKSHRKNNFMESLHDRVTEEPLMYMYGGVSIDTAGFCDPHLYQLVRYTEYASAGRKRQDPLMGSLDEMDSVGKSDGIQPHVSSPHIGFSDSVEIVSKNHSYTNNSRGVSARSVRSVHSNASTKHSFIEVARPNIWHNLLHKTGENDLEKRPPENWQELRLSLTSPTSQRIFPNKRKGKEVNKETLASFNKSQQNSRISTASGKLQSTGGTLSAPPGSPALRSQNVHTSYSEGGIKPNSITQYGSRVITSPLGSPSRARTAPGLTGSSLINSRPTTSPIDSQSDSLLSLKSGILPHPSTLSPFSRPMSRDSKHQLVDSQGKKAFLLPFSHYHNPSNQVEAEEFRAHRVEAIASTLRPITKSQTKKKAQEEFLKIFPPPVDC